MEDAKLKSSEQVKDHTVMEPLEVELTSYQEVQKVKKDTKTSNSSTERDLDVFLLGDTGNSDDEPGTPYQFCLSNSVSERCTGVLHVWVWYISVYIWPCKGFQVLE